MSKGTKKSKWPHCLEAEVLSGQQTNGQVKEWTGRLATGFQRLGGRHSQVGPNKFLICTLPQVMHVPSREGSRQTMFLVFRACLLTCAEM
jgi:hypothetical protein